MNAASQLQQPAAVRLLDGPWMANKQWAAGRIGDSSLRSLVLTWIFALIWNAFAWILGIAVAERLRKSDGWERFLVSMFPLVGLLALIGAIYVTARFLKFGRSYLELETIPGCVGGWLAGTVRTSAALREAESIRLALRCVNRVTRGSGKNASTTESTIYEDEQTLVGKLPSDRDGGNAIPVAFRIPRGCQPTRDRHRDDMIWRLRVRAAMPGADYAADFIVPVFDAQQPDGFVPQAEALAAKLRASRARIATLDDPQIDISVNGAGRKRLVFPPRRNRATAIVATIFAIVFGGVAVLIGPQPIILPMAFGAVGLALAYVAALYWFRDVELRVDRHGIELQWRMLGFGGTRRIAAGDIIDIKSKINSQANDTPYHTVYATVAGGTDVALVSGLRTGDATHIVEEIGSALGTAAVSGARS